MKKWIFAGLIAAVFSGCAGSDKFDVSMERNEAAKKLSKLEENADKKPDDPNALYELARAHAAIDSLRLALTEVNDVLRKEPAFYQAYLLKADILTRLGRNDDVLKNWLALLNTSPEQSYVDHVSHQLGMPYSIESVSVGPGDNYRARYSPDGSMLIWQSNRDGNWNIYLREPGRSLPRQLTISEGDDEFPVFSMDGKTIAFTSTRDELEPKAPGNQNRELYLMPLNSRNATRLSENSFDDWAPFFGRDSVSLYFLSEREHADEKDVTLRKTQIYRLNLQDSTLTQVTSGDADNTSAVELRPGVLAWIRIAEGQYAVVVQDGQAKTPRVLYSSSDPKSGLCASPDGSRLAFFMKKNDNIDLWMMGADGTKPGRLTAHAANELYPAFSPDGQFLLFSSNRDGAYRLYRMNLAMRTPAAELQVRIEEMLPEKNIETSAATPEE